MVRLLLDHEADLDAVTTGSSISAWSASNPAVLHILKEYDDQRALLIGEVKTANVPDLATADHRDSSDSNGIGVASGTNILPTMKGVPSVPTGCNPKTWSGRFSLLLSPGMCPGPGTTTHAHAG